MSRHFCIPSWTLRIYSVTYRDAGLLCSGAGGGAGPAKECGSCLEAGAACNPPCKHLEAEHLLTMGSSVKRAQRSFSRLYI